MTGIVFAFIIIVETARTMEAWWTGTAEAIHQVRTDTSVGTRIVEAIIDVDFARPATESGRTFAGLLKVEKMRMNSLEKFCFSNFNGK